jgi:WD40 repeat protein
MHVCPVKNLLFIGTAKGMLICIDLKTFELKHSFQIESSGISCIIPSFRDISLYLGSESGDLYHFESEDSIISKKIHQHRISGMIMFQCYLVTASVDKFLKFENVKTLETVIEKKNNQHAYALIKSFENVILTVGFASSDLEIWKLSGEFEMFRLLSEKIYLNIHFEFI